MYSSIMVPVDLEHSDKLDKALSTAADLSKHYNATLCLVGVTMSAPTAVAHNPTEFGEKLAEFAAEQTTRHGVEVNTKSMVSNDPTIDLGDALQRAASELDADLVVMGSHVPGFAEHVFSSNAGYLAEHAKLSVFVVR